MVSGRRFLHVGCGEKHRQQTTPGFAGEGWDEVRLDIDPQVNPDIIGSVVNMEMVPSGTMDAVFSCHSLEHLYAHEVPLALAEFKRVLVPDGFVIIKCPDLQAVASVVASGNLMRPFCVSNAGPLAAIDMLYGFRPALKAGNSHMGHRFGFTRDSLAEALADTGFESVAGFARGLPFCELWMVASNSVLTTAQLQQLAKEHFPQGSETQSSSPTTP